MKDTFYIRYTGFRPAEDGGRLLDFSISAPQRAHFLTSFEVPAELIVGTNRVRIQDAASICYAKIRHLCEVNPDVTLPEKMVLSSTDIAQYNYVLQAAA